MLIGIYLVILGMIVGSFLNVCIYRIPAKESIVWPRSHCMSCGHTLGAGELIPVISYLMLGGKCKNCKAKISPRYMIVEICTGLSIGLVYRQYGLSMELVLYSAFVFFAIVLSLIDWDHMILPTVVIRVGCIVGFVLRLMIWFMRKDTQDFMDALLGAIIGYLIMMIIYYGSLFFLKKEGMGYGDVRLMAFLGLYVGLKKLCPMLIIACLLAAIYGIVLYIKRKKSEPFPLGPFLNLGGFMMVLWGTQLIDAYLGLFGL